MNKTKIEWCDVTWNPVTGCLNDCEYCYARKIAHRFAERTSTGEITEYGDLHTVGESNTPYPFGFDPTMRWDRLTQPSKDKHGKNIFVCSMSDLFGDWIPNEWLLAVINACLDAPQHQYIFLTKYPQNYLKVDELLRHYYKQDYPNIPPMDNFWFGSTLTGVNDKDYPIYSKKYNIFLNIEPLLAEINLPKHHRLQWVIIGAETGNRKGKIIPKREWVEEVVEWAKKDNLPVFMKDSLIPVIGEENMLREYPFYKD